MMTHDQQQAAEAEPTGDIPMGVVWDEGEPPPGAPPPEDGAPTEAQPEAEGEAVQGTVVHSPEAGEAVTPKRALLDDINARLKATFEAWHTYAMLAWAQRWQTAEAYVQDPDLYREIVEEAEAEIRRQRATVAKRLDKARVRKDEAQIKLLTEEQAQLERKAPSAMRMDALVLKARGGRLARQAALPVCVAFGPLVALFAGGLWWPLLAYPVAWGWLAVQGHAIAVASGTAEAAPVEGQARVLAPQGGAPPASPAPANASVGASAAENTILAHLADWQERASGRGLEGVIPASPVLDSLGIRVVLTTTGKITPEALLKREDALRAALDIPADVKMVVSPGASGQEAVLRIRTRTPRLDTRWNPGRAGVGFVPETGRTVDVDAYGHRLVAGVTGAGKSTAMRPWMASVVLNPRAQLVFIDPKGQEAGLWEHCARTVKGVGSDGQAAMYAVICAVADELEWRQESAQGTDWEPTEDHPELVVVIDEGAALVRMSKVKAYRDVLSKVEYLATQGRAGRVWVHWATQYPTKSEGVPAQVAENILARMCLALDSPQSDRVMFGEQATATGWSPSRLDMPGWALVRTGPADVPEQVATWHMDDDQVRALPARSPWGGAPEAPPGAGGMPPALRAALTLSEGARGVTGHEIADGCGMDLVDMQEELRQAGVLGSRFTNSEGRQVRGYPREVLEEAASRYEG